MFYELGIDEKFKQTLTFWFQKWHDELSGLSLGHPNI